MAETQSKDKNNGVAQVEKQYIKGDGLWIDAGKRLFRNRAAVLGIFIIFVNIFAAFFASSIAPSDFATQNRDDHDAAPLWVINFFTSMTPKDENYRPGRGWVALVNTGDKVSKGDPIMSSGEGDEIEYQYANMGGMIFELDRQLFLTRFEYDDYTVPADWEIIVTEGQGVQHGDVLAAERGGDGKFVVTLEDINETVRHVVYFDPDNEQRILVRSAKIGYVTVRGEYPLGADNLGRDLFSRIIYGAQVSLLIAFVGPMVSLMIGVPYGLVAGYFGGHVDNVMMRFVDIMYAFPTLLLIILLMAFFRSSYGGSTAASGTFAATLSELDRKIGGLLFIFIGVGLTSWMGMARLTRAQVLSLRETEFIVAANSMGMKTPAILTRHVLPNVLGPIIVSETLTIPAYIRYEAFLSFIGLGVNPPQPSWGGMISDGATQLRSYPHQTLFPALALFFIMFAFNFLGDGLRDALDPRMRGVD